MATLPTKRRSNQRTRFALYRKTHASGKKIVKNSPKFIISDETLKKAKVKRQKGGGNHFY
jgi:hypothetical protein